MTNSDLKQRAESLIRLHTELDEAKLALADAYEDAESAGYSKAVLRRAISDELHGTNHGEYSVLMIWEGEGEPA